MEDLERGNNLVKSNIGSVPSREQYGSVSAVSVPLRSRSGVGAASTVPLHERQAVDPANTKVRDYIGLRFVEHLGYLEINELMIDEYNLKDCLLRAWMYKENWLGILTKSLISMRFGATAPCVLPPFPPVMM
jgi:hypothetical protein